ncbi:hypothetical protein IQ37_18260 [Chryseobacterium piperi]|uniref:Uncharacterized protein n=1 Tax=Chryseobacterium piperi TaxID=558152 RepID=A0A086AGN8_9FLAO|nr:hypothetical protein [Chryseobacterium piperi]ASW73917.1 hypothetical protein CJF12_06170 [Chryseobacterium piperi]KFF15852.1 hypothetical protein IQ37_18260 [Chryseobacterium piperi]
MKKIHPFLVFIMISLFFIFSSFTQKEKENFFPVLLAGNYDQNPPVNINMDFTNTKDNRLPEPDQEVYESNIDSYVPILFLLGLALILYYSGARASSKHH